MIKENKRITLIKVYMYKYYYYYYSMKQDKIMSKFTILCCKLFIMFWNLSIGFKESSI